MNPVSKKRQRENRQRKKVIVEATGGETPPCEVCGRPADDAHERLSRARGGSITDLTNLVWLCRPCHTFITEHPALAERSGWSLKSPPRRAS